MDQTVMSCKLTTTEENLTAYADLGLFGEFCAAMKLSDQINRHLSKPVSAKGFMPDETPFLSPVHVVPFSESQMNVSSG